MSLRNVMRLWVLLVPLGVLLAMPAPAWADEPITLQLQAPQRVTLGEKVTVTATLLDGKGAPIRGAVINFWIPSTFLSTGGAIQLGQVTTNEQGKAVLAYQARTEDTVTLKAYFSGNSQYAFADASTEMTVAGSSQLYRSTAGVQLPGITVWLLVGVLGTVWSIYLMVMVLLTLIARAGSDTPSRAGGGHV